MTAEREQLEKRLAALEEAVGPGALHPCLCDKCEHENGEECFAALTQWATAIGQALALVRAALG